jgi:hypothetical protein
MSEHSPTPWEVRKVFGRASSRIFSADGWGLATLHHRDRTGGDGFLPSEAGANARLIAAAPALLEALQDMLTAFEHYEEYYGPRAEGTYCQSSPRRHRAGDREDEMSLDVYLTVENQEPVTVEKIVIREGGHIKQLTRVEWDQQYPDREPLIVDSEDTNVFWANITHNLNRMADEAELYKALWRPDENGMTRASQLIEPLQAGLALLRGDRQRFEVFNPENGWGDYDGLVSFVEDYLEACQEYPDALVYVSR